MPPLPDDKPVTPPATVRTVTVRRWRSGQVEQVQDDVAEEVPVAFTYHGIPHVVMLATPKDLEDLGIGFTFTEGLVETPEEVRGVEAATLDNACELRLNIAPERFSALLLRQRNLTGRTGCGLCGTETLEEAIRRPAPVGPGVTIAPAELHAALRDLQTKQPLNARTGSVHAAAWCLPGRGVQVVREDVGRHNALDKVVGALLRSGADASTGYLLVSSRASYEMVQKAATAGVSLLAAISAPTALAIRLAEDCGMTLIGFARDDSHVVYTHPHRVP
ncbi:MAG: NAD-linked formate dehydrogenase, molybdenum containing, accessory protein [Pseudomonadota bacterium]